MRQTRVGYLTAEYPVVSHTFIEREVAALRRLGVDISTFSVRRTPEDKLLSDVHRRAAAETFSILPVTVTCLLAAHLRGALCHPGRYARTLRRALSLSSGGVRPGLWQFFYFAEAIVLWNECRRRKITHVHAHFANVASAVAMLLAHFGAADGITWSFTMHGPTEFDDVSRFTITEKIRSAAFVACISDYCRAQMMRLVEPSEWEKLAVVRCGLDVRRLPASRHDVAPDGGPLRVLTIGRLVPDKGQMLLLRALAELRDKGVPATLTMIGDGPDRAVLERAARRLHLADCVEFTGSLGQPEVAKRFESADVFCLPSFAEGLPVVLMEAMSHCLPVVATRIAGVAELVEDGVAGALVSPARIDQLLAALARLADDPDLRWGWGQAGRARVERDYDVNRSAQALARLFTGADGDEGHPAEDARELESVAW